MRLSSEVHKICDISIIFINGHKCSVDQYCTILYTLLHQEILEAIVRKIEIDEDVFHYLQAHAVPLEDSTSSVLRRLLKIDRNSGRRRDVKRRGQAQKASGESRDGLMNKVLLREFGDSFSKVGRYKTLFSDNGNLVYFQNFNKRGAPTLWYRLSGSAWSLLRERKEKSSVCFTNPAESFFYLIPVTDILEALAKASVPIDSVEVIIAAADDRWKWRNLNWNIKEYLHQY